MIPRRWSTWLAEACTATDTPGAVLGVRHAGRTTVVPYGVLHTATGHPVSAGSVFQVGSITKTWVGLQVAQLADVGRLTLDSTVAELLPGVRLGSPDVADRVTVRMLLSHTSGLDGDVFTDTGRGDDAVERFVDRLADVAVVHEPGAAYSYCNTGFVLLGRILEVLDGRPWPATLQRRVAAPLGLTDVCVRAEDALLHDPAVGHEDGAPVTRWQLPDALGAAGTVTTSAGSLLTFAAQWLGEVGPALARTTEPLVGVPDAAADAGEVGWAWRVGRWGADREHVVIGHDGETMGQTATLRVVPSLDLAVCVLTNALHATDVHQHVVPRVVEELTGVAVPGPPQPDPRATLVDPERFVGTYARRAARYDVTLEGGALWLTATSTSELSGDEPPERMPLVPLAGDADGTGFVRRPAGTSSWSVVRFAPLPDGTPALRAQGRMAPRVVPVS